MKTCLRCGEPFEPSGRKAYCSTRCRRLQGNAIQADKHLPRPRPPRRCLRCGSLFEPWKGRIYCSWSCYRPGVAPWNEWPDVECSECLRVVPRRGQAQETCGDPQCVRERRNWTQRRTKRRRQRRSTG